MLNYIDFDLNESVQGRLQSTPPVQTQAGQPQANWADQSERLLAAMEMAAAGNKERLNAVKAETAAAAKADRESRKARNEELLAAAEGEAGRPSEPGNPAAFSPFDRTFAGDYEAPIY